MKGKHAQKNFGAVGTMAPTPLSLKSGGGGGGGGGGGLGGVAYKDRARPPHLCVQPCGNTSMVKMASEYACRKGYTLRACLPAGPRPP